MYRTLFLGLCCLSAPACTWVALEKPAEDVLVLPAERLPDDCKSLGKVKVSVLDNVGVLERHADEVIRDLDVLARNHAAKQDGDTVVALGPVTDGARQYEVYRCTASAAKNASEKAEPEDNGVEVLPYDGGSDGN